MKAKEDHYYRSVCPYCNKRFYEPSSAKKHIEFEHGTVPFRCDACNKTFHSKQGKEYHDSVKHLTGKVSVQCSICEKVLASKISLNAHMKYVHSEERKHSCSRCDSKFKHKKDLKNHCLYVHNSNQYEEFYLQSEDVKKSVNNVIQGTNKKKISMPTSEISILGTSMEKRLFCSVIYAH